MESSNNRGRVFPGRGKGVTLTICHSHPDHRLPLRAVSSPTNWQWRGYAHSLSLRVATVVNTKPWPMRTGCDLLTGPASGFYMPSANDLGQPSRFIFPTTPQWSGDWPGSVQPVPRGSHNRLQGNPRRPANWCRSPDTISCRRLVGAVILLGVGSRCSR
jgi:hypothetical protein